jgi:hypothetical protein
MQTISASSIAILNEKQLRVKKYNFKTIFKLSVSGAKNRKNMTQKTKINFIADTSLFFQRISFNIN